MVELWLSFVYGGYNGAMIVYLTEIMPARVRATGFSLAYSLATALFGMAAGSAAAAFVIIKVMNLTFTWLPGPSLLAAAGAVVATVALGLVGTFSALGQKPAPVLRNL